MGFFSKKKKKPAAAAAAAGGGGAAAAPVPNPQDKQRSAEIEAMMKSAQEEERRKVKLLLLGAGESGKSTVFKQMRILYGTDRPDEELRLYGVVIRHNIITMVRKLCGLIKTLEFADKLSSDNAAGFDVSPKAAYETLMTNVVNMMSSPSGLEVNPRDWVGKDSRAGLAANNDAQLFLKYKDDIDVLWKSSTMKDVWLQRSQANIMDGHAKYLDATQRIASESFKPTQQDVLLARIRTQQITMERYTIDGTVFEMYDVGGQRSERRKWIDCFDDVGGVIFVAALSEFDQTLVEAKRTNRMVEALELFKGVCNNRAFAKTSIMLFLNKKDLFQEKIMYINIADVKHFADYEGPERDFDQGVLYFIQKFKDCQLDKKFQDNFIHVTCATDTGNMEFVLDSTRMIIMTENLKKSGILGE